MRVDDSFARVLEDAPRWCSRQARGSSKQRGPSAYLVEVPVGRGRDDRLERSGARGAPARDRVGVPREPSAGAICRRGARGGARRARPSEPPAPPSRSAHRSRWRSRAPSRSACPCSRSVVVIARGAAGTSRRRSWRACAGRGGDPARPRRSGPRSTARSAPRAHWPTRRLGSARTSSQLDRAMARAGWVHSDAASAGPQPESAPRRGLARRWRPSSRGSRRPSCAWPRASRTGARSPGSSATSRAAREVEVGESVEQEIARLGAVITARSAAGRMLRRAPARARTSRSASSRAGRRAAGRRTRPRRDLRRAPIRAPRRRCDSSRAARIAPR